MFTGPKSDYMAFYDVYTRGMESRSTSNWTQCDGPKDIQDIGTQIADKIFHLVPDFGDNQDKYSKWGSGYVTVGYRSDAGALRLTVFGGKDQFRLEFLIGFPEDDFLIHATRIDRLTNTVSHLHVDKDKQLTQYNEPYVYRK